MQKEAIRRVHPDIVDDARKTYRINKNPTHPDIITVEERSVASDRATCGSCEKTFKKGDKALYIEHHVDKDKNPYHINRKHVCFDKCEHKDGPAKKEKAKSKKKSPAKEENAEQQTEQAQKAVGGDKRTHPCPYVIHGCGFEGNMEQIKKHLNPKYQNDRTQAGDPEEVAECYYNRYKNASIKSAHCGHCGETLDLDVDKVKEHIQGDGKEFTELQKRIQEMQEEDKDTIEELDEGEISRSDLLEHIQGDSKEFDDLIEQIQDMKKEDEEFASELRDNRTYSEATDEYHSTDDLAQFGFSSEEIESIKNLDRYLTSYNNHHLITKTAYHDPRKIPHLDDVTRQQDAIDYEESKAKFEAVDKNHPQYKKLRKEYLLNKVQHERNQRYNSTEELAQLRHPEGHSRAGERIFSDDDIESIRRMTEQLDPSSTAVGTSKTVKNLGHGFKNDDTSEAICPTCGNHHSGESSETNEPTAATHADRIISQDPAHTTLMNAIQLIHGKHEAISSDDRRLVYDVTLGDHKAADSFVLSTYTHNNVWHNCPNCNQYSNAHPELTASQIVSNRRKETLSSAKSDAERSANLKAYEIADNTPTDNKRNKTAKEAFGIGSEYRKHKEETRFSDRDTRAQITRIEHLDKLSSLQSDFMGPQGAYTIIHGIVDKVVAGARSGGMSFRRWGRAPRKETTMDDINRLMLKSDATKQSKFGSFREVSHIDDRLQLLSEEQLEAVSRKINDGKNVPIEEWGSSTHVHVPTEDGEEVVNTPSLTDALNSIGVWDSGDVPSFKLGPTTSSFKSVKIAHGDPETHIHSPFGDDEIIPAIEYPKDDVTPEEAKTHLQTCDEQRHDAISPSIGTCDWCDTPMSGTNSSCKHVVHFSWFCPNSECPQYPERVSEDAGINVGGAGSALSYPNLQAFNRGVRDHMLNVLKMVRPGTGKFGSFKSVKIAQDGGGGDGGSGGDGGGAASGGDSGAGEGGDSGYGGGSDPGLSEGPHGEGQSPRQDFTLGAEVCPRCGQRTFSPINGGAYYSCYCGYSAIPPTRIKKRRQSHIDNNLIKHSVDRFRWKNWDTPELLEPVFINGEWPAVPTSRPAIPTPISILSPNEIQIRNKRNMTPTPVVIDTISSTFGGGRDIPPIGLKLKNIDTDEILRRPRHKPITKSNADIIDISNKDTKLLNQLKRLERLDELEWQLKNQGQGRPHGGVGGHGAGGKNPDFFINDKKPHGGAGGHGAGGKNPRRSSWIDHTAPPAEGQPVEEDFINDTFPVVPQMYVNGEALRPAPGTQDNLIFNQPAKIAPLFNAPMMLVNASVHEGAPTIVRHEKVWKRIHKIHTPRDGICPRCHKHIDYLGLCNTCRLEVGMQWHHWNSEALMEGSNDF